MFKNIFQTKKEGSFKKTDRKPQQIKFKTCAKCEKLLRELAESFETGRTLKRIKAIRQLDYYCIAIKKTYVSIQSITIANFKTQHI